MRALCANLGGCSRGVHRTQHSSRKERSEGKQLKILDAPVIRLRRVQGKFEGLKGEKRRNELGRWLILAGTDPSQVRALLMERNTTFDELAQAKPRRGSGAPVRSRSHYDAILELLRERGPQGVLGSELYSRPDLYGRSPRNRISELRKDVYLIEGNPHGTSDWFYRLIRDNSGVKPFADSPDWYERTTGHPRPQMQSEDFSDLPLFGGKR